MRGRRRTGGRRSYLWGNTVAEGHGMAERQGTVTLRRTIHVEMRIWGRGSCEVYLNGRYWSTISS